MMHLCLRDYRTLEVTGAKGRDGPSALDASGAAAPEIGEYPARSAPWRST